MMTQAIGYASPVERTHGLIFRVNESTKDRWDAATAGRKISQQEAGRSLVEWFVTLDELTQAMILGQIPATEELIEIALRTAAKRPVEGKVRVMQAARTDGTTVTRIPKKK